MIETANAATETAPPAQPNPKTVKTTFSWAPSPDYIIDVASGEDLSKAAVLIKTIVNNKGESEEVVAADTLEKTVTATEGDHVVILVAYRNRFGFDSKARPYDIVVGSGRTPDPVGQIGISRVVPGLTVIQG